MSEKFSASLRIADLNDFIAPSQGCIVSLKGTKPPKFDRIEVGEHYQLVMDLWSIGHGWFYRGSVLQSICIILHLFVAFWNFRALLFGILSCMKIANLLFM